MRNLLQHAAQVDPGEGADQRSDERGAPADHGREDQLAGSRQEEGVRRHVALEYAEQPSGEPGVGRRQDERAQLVALRVVAHRRGAPRVGLDRAQHHAVGRSDDAPRDDVAREEDGRDERVQRPARLDRVDVAEEPEARGGHPGQAVLASGPGGERRVLEEERHLAERERDHREVDADAPQRDVAHDQPVRGGCGHADQQGERHAAQGAAGEQPGGDEAAGAVERRLAEGQHSGEAEQDVEAQPEQPPDQRAREHVGGDVQRRRDPRQEREHREDDAFGAQRAQAAHPRPSVPSSPRGSTNSISAMSAYRATSE